MAKDVERSEVRYGTQTIGYSIRRSNKRNTVSIAIDPTDGVLVTAPRPASREKLDDVIRSKAFWITKRLRRQSDLPPPPIPKEFVSGETFLYLGKQYRLLVELNRAPKPLRLEGGLLRVSVPRGLGAEHRASYVRAALIDWYRARAERRIPGRVLDWAKRLNVAPREVLVREPRKRWGSASSSNAIRINWRIIQATPPLIEYVVAHEVVHLRHPNHTSAFWDSLGRVLPAYQSGRDALRSQGPNLIW